MLLFTPKQYKQLLENGVASKATEGGIDHIPVVKLFTANANGTWLLSELYPDDPTIAFGLCDLGMGYPEMGDVSLTEIQAVSKVKRILLERDVHFEGTKPLSEYAQEARSHGRIVN